MLGHHIHSPGRVIEDRRAEYMSMRSLCFDRPPTTWGLQPLNPSDPTTVIYAAFAAAADTFQKSRRCALSVAEIVPRLRTAIEKADLWVLHEIDPQMLLRRGGYSIDAARQILFFHPRFVVAMLQADPASLLEAPLKLAIIERPDGSSDLRWQDPAAAFLRYGNAALADVGRELAATCDRIVDEAIKEAGHRVNT